LHRRCPVGRRKTTCISFCAISSCCGHAYANPDDSAHGDTCGAYADHEFSLMGGPVQGGRSSCKKIAADMPRDVKAKAYWHVATRSRTAMPRRGWPVHRNDNRIRYAYRAGPGRRSFPALTLFPPRSLQNILKIEETSDKGEREDSGHGCSRATAPQLQGKAVVHGWGSFRNPSRSRRRVAAATASPRARPSAPP
jgi:hypothetical protein